MLFEQGLRQLLSLHQLMLAGEGDSEAADDLRDQLDATLRGLPAEASELLSAVSEALYEDTPKILRG